MFRCSALQALAACLLVIALASDVFALERAGSSAAVRGQVARANDEHPVGVQLASGEPIYLADRITSGADSGMQIMLLDQTTFTIGPDSFVKIDEFVYDPTTNAGKVTASLGKGVFRFVTGKIAATNPSSMTVKLPNATIGIRGTMVIGSTDGERTIVGLVGPGPDNNTRDKAAGIDVITADGTVGIRRPGWGALIEPGRLPIVRQLSKSTVDGIVGRIAPRRAVAVSGATNGGGGAAQPSALGASSKAAASGQSGSGAGGKSSAALANDTAGQTDASALPAIGIFAIVNDVVAPIAKSTTNAVQNDPNSSSSSGGGSSSSGGGGTPFNPPIVPSGATQYTELRTLTTGTGTFIQSNVPIFLTINGNPVSQIGSYNFRMDINFGLQSLAASFVINTSGPINTNPNSTLNINQAYGNLSGSVAGSNGAQCGASTFCGAAFNLQNASNTIGKVAFHAVSVTNTGNTASGSGNVARP
jgi:hypothetical protein